MRLVDADILDAGGRFVTVDIDDAIDQQKWITMWQHRQKFLDVRNSAPALRPFTLSLI